MFFCDSAEEVQNHTLQRRCVAFIAVSDATTMEVEAEGTSSQVAVWGEEYVGWI